MDCTVYDVIVVGAGIVGSSTAYHLIKNGAEKVLLLEQFSVRHTRGSSHGSSRVTRRGYSNPIYTPLMDEAYKLWEKLERESGTKLYINTGYLLFGPKDHKCISNVIHGLQVGNTPHETYSGEEAMKRYPNQLRIPSDYQCVYDQDGGILLADKALEAFQKLFVKSRGVLLDNQKVTEITPGHVITLKTASGNVFQAKKLVITVGAWAAKVMRTLGVELPLKVIKSDVLYWEVTHPKDYSWENFPVFANYTEEDDKYIQCYGMPIYEFPGLLKVCLRGGPVIDPDCPDRDSTPHSTDVVSSFIKRHIMNVSTLPTIHESCLFTCTPNYHPIIDRHPLHDNIVVGVGFTGHGFKLSPVTGKILSELALDIPISYDLSLFKITDRLSTCSEDDY